MIGEAPPRATTPIPSAAAYAKTTAGTWIGSAGSAHATLTEAVAKGWFAPPAQRKPADAGIVVEAGAERMEQKRRA
jgi:hypothetical protein